jgi:predicted DCC family thiol-disulfide oxidoreductase YuxK
MRMPQPAPGVTANDRVVLFDGICKLCSGWARFLMRHDTRHRFKLATVQSEEGQAILRWAGLPTQAYDTLVLVEGDRVHLRSAAVIRVLARLPLPWKLGALAWLLPSPWRDWAYDRIARNRYRLFGQYDSCAVPTPDHTARFLKHGA